jgi:hypothetical protein
MTNREFANELYTRELSRLCGLSQSEFNKCVDRVLAEPRAVGGELPKKDERRRRKEAEDEK